MSKVIPFQDGLKNLLARIGTGKGKGDHTHYVDICRNPEELRAAYENSWLPAKIVDIPARDSIRQWRAWSDNPEAEAEEQRLGLRRAVLQALTAARLYGGAAIYVDTGTGTPNVELQDSETIERLVVLTADDVQWPAHPNDPLESMGDMFRVGTRDVHTSRLALFQGVPPTAGQYGWGQSVLKRAWDAILNADSVPAAVADLVWESKLDVYKIQDFMQNVGSPGYEQKILERLELVNTGKSLTNALLLDKEEDYEQKQISFADLSNLVMTMYQVAAGAADIPVTRLLGQSASGLNSAGDNEIRDYYDHVRTIQELQIAPALSRIDRHISGGAVDYDWLSLWQMSPQESADTLGKQATAVSQLAESGIIAPDVLYQPAVDMLNQTMPGIAATAGEYTGGPDADAF